MFDLMFVYVNVHIDMSARISFSHSAVDIRFLEILTQIQRFELCQSPSTIAMIILFAGSVQLRLFF